MTKNPQTPAQLLFAAIVGLAAGMGNPFGTRGKSEPKARRPVPTMVTASPEEIAAWNAAVAVKPRNRTKLHRKPRGDSGQHPKFPKARVHQQHKHPLRDEHGAYTLVGRNTFVPSAQPWDQDEWVPGRRVWLAGISAQRGY